MPVRSVCVFCGASIGATPAYREAAIALGQAIARRGLTLVYGGGAVGLMGTVADAAMAAGGEVIGIIPESLMNAEIGHKGLSRLEVVDGMHARKARMAELSDASSPCRVGWVRWKNCSRYGPGGNWLSRQAAGAAGCERLLREAGRVPRPYRRRRLCAAAASGNVAAGAAAGRAAGRYGQFCGAGGAEVGRQAA